MIANAAARRKELDRIEGALAAERETYAQTETALEQAISRRDKLAVRETYNANEDAIAQLEKDLGWRRRELIRREAEVVTSPSGLSSVTARARQRRPAARRMA